MTAALMSPFAAELTDADATRLAAVLKALADPVRLRLLSLIDSGGPDGASPSDLIPHVGLSQPTVAHHLRLLHAAGLITTEKVGVWRIHRLDHDRLAAVADLLQPGRSQRLDTYRSEADELRERLAVTERARQAAGAELAGTYQDLRKCREQLDDAREVYGDKLCPRCSVQVTAEVAAEKAGDAP